MDENDYFNAIAPYQDALKVLMDHVSLVRDGQGKASLRLKGDDDWRALTEKEADALSNFMDAESPKPRRKMLYAEIVPPYDMAELVAKLEKKYEGMGVNVRAIEMVGGNYWVEAVMELD